MQLFSKISSYCEYPFQKQGDVIFDSNTGLYWEFKSTDEQAVNYGGKRFSFAGAEEEHAAALNAAAFGGYDDWRVPNKDELRSIFNYGQQPSVIDAIFGMCPVGDYWTRNIYKLQPYFSWVLFSGLGSGIAKTVSAENYVIACRGGYDRRFGEADETRFIDNGDGTVTDAVTGLMWQKATNERKAPREAEIFCRDLRLAGYSDWRLPNIKELNTILNLAPEQNNWYFDSYFPIPENEAMLHYSSCDIFDKHYTWVTNFTYGYDGYYGDREALLLFRAVRYDKPAPAVKPAAPFVITHTGQNRAFDLKGREVAADRIWGLDAQRPGIPQKFTAEVNGLIRDEHTGLFWDNAHNSLQMTWKEAMAYADSLCAQKYLGRDDWRLPSREELRSIVRYDDTIPAVDSSIFPGTLPEFYWTGDSHKIQTDNAWGFYFGYGCAYSAPKENTGHVRFVAGRENAFAVPSGQRFVLHPDGTVTDTVTQLMWICEEMPMLVQKEALVYCQELKYAGYHDWKMPTLKELATLINLREGNTWYYPALFPDTNTKPQGFYQSSTVYGGTFGWGVNFQFGFDGYYADRMNGKYPFRPVRILHENK